MPPALRGPMTPREAADRLLRAEVEYRAAQLEHNGTMRATVRYQAARREQDIAFAVARAVLVDEVTPTGGSTT